MKKHYYLYVYLEVHLLLSQKIPQQKTEVYAQVGRLDERITETRSVLDNRITMSVKNLTIASRVSMFD